MAKRNKMSESELSALLDSQIADAVSYEESELASLRDKALKYREGVMDDLPAETGKSSVVSMDVNDTISWIKPGLMRIFANSDRVVQFEPTGPGDEEYAAQATDYINYLFLRECKGYKVLLEAFDDSLGLGNGVVMHWWDHSPCYEVETFSGLSDDAFTLLVSDDDVEVVEHTAYADPQATYAAAAPVNAPGMVGPDGAPAIGDPDGDAANDGSSLPEGSGGFAPSVPASIHDVKIKRTVRTGKLCIAALPPEELLIPRDAKAIDEEISGIGRERTVTRSSLIKEGFDRAIVEALPAYSVGLDDKTQNSRDSLRSWDGSANPDKSMEKVKIYEWYPLVDYDGDGVAERRRVIIGDRSENAESRKILLNEEWGDELPFTDLVPNPVAHRRRGRSVFDDTQDIQRIKSVLLRQTLDNLYLVNNPQWVVVHSQIDNMDAVGKREIGANILAKQRGAIDVLETPFVAQQSFPVLEYMDLIKQGRTGVGRQTMGLDPDALQNQTAEAVRDGRAASETQVEFYARNIAEMGLQRLFGCILKLVIKHQDRPKTIRLRDKWVEMDPRPWNAEMDCTINVGLGAGSRDRDMVMLQQIAGKQEQILQLLGPDNPICDIALYRNTLAQMVEVGGLKSAEKYFKEVTPESIQAMMQAQSQKPDPKMIEAQGRLALQQQAAAAKLEADKQKAEHDRALKMEQMRSDMALEMQKMRAEMALERQQLSAEMELKRQQIVAELQVKRELGVMNAHVSMATSQVEVGGEPG